MRLLATLALAALTGTAVAATVENIIIKNDERSYSYISGRVDDSLRDLGRHFAAFELDGVPYLITDDATLETIAKVVEPEVELGRQQAELGKRQAELGAEQAKLGAEQARLGAKQAAAARSGDAQREIGEKQREIAGQQRKLGERQRELGEQQRALGDKQRELSRDIQKELENIFRNAVSRGVARRR
jgi:multidrug efflux pump subunit AcrA (membrane-fusion protein)